MKDKKKIRPLGLHMTDQEWQEITDYRYKHKVSIAGLVAQFLLDLVRKKRNL